MSRTSEGKEREREAIGRILEQPGYVLLKANARVGRRAEVDAIFEYTDTAGRGTLVFVEVRTRSAWRCAVESVDWEKRRRIATVIHAVLARYRGRASTVRMDVMALEEGRWTWIQNAWQDD